MENDTINNLDEYGTKKRKRGGPRHGKEGIKLRCKERNTCQAIRNKMWILTMMIHSHQGWDWRVPKPRGGSRHKGEIADLWNAYAKCQYLFEKKCKNECDKSRNKSWFRNCRWFLIPAAGYVLFKLGKAAAGWCVGGPVGGLIGAAT